MIYPKYILFTILLIIFSKILYSKSPDEIIKESIANYPGKCPCPYSLMSNGRKCGKKSAYNKPGGYEPICYVNDIRVESVFAKTKLKVIDGDTIHLGKIKYRLHGIDSPEIKQKCTRENKTYLCGVEAKKFLESLIENNKVFCKKKNIDRYKRIVAVCYHENKNLNKLMVRNGWAIAYRRYSDEYIDDESYAKKNKLGIWQGKFLEPYKWRKKNR